MLSDQTASLSLEPRHNLIKTLTKLKWSVKSSAARIQGENDVRETILSRMGKMRPLKILRFKKLAEAQQP